MTHEGQAAKIRERFAELLNSESSRTTRVTLKLVATEFDVPLSVVTDAITLSEPKRKGARK